MQSPTQENDPEDASTVILLMEQRVLERGTQLTRAMRLRLSLYVHFRQQ